MDNNKNSKGGFDRIIKIISGILIPVVLLFISYNFSKKLEKGKDIDIFLDYSSNLEKSYRYIKNYFEEQASGSFEQQPSIFRERLTCLDYSIISFYFKTMMLYTPDKSNFKKALGLMDSLYWGKQNIVGKGNSFREFLIKNEALFRNDRNRFIMEYKDIKDVFQYFDDLMHLSILNTSFSIHTQGEKIIKGFEQLNDDIRYLEKKVYSEKKQKFDKIMRFLTPTHTDGD